MTTKEKLLYESLKLFAIKGFEDVSMRDIGTAVGIRESSIYKHYHGKQAILDAIVVKAMEEMDHLFIQLDVPSAVIKSSLARYVEMSFEDIALMCTKMLRAQQNNEMISSFRRLVTIEQYRNKALQKIYIEMFMERQLQYNEKVFSYLLEMGILKGSSAKLIALEFFAPLFMLQYQFQNNQELLEATLQEHVINFIKEHLKGD